jgi:acyl carrier protein
MPDKAIRKIVQPNIIGKCKLSEEDIRRQDLERQIMDLIIAEGKIDISRVTPDATLASLNVQSVDIVMFMMAIEEKFGVYIPIDGELAEAKDLNKFVKSIADHILAHG